MAKLGQELAQAIEKWPERVAIAESNQRWSYRDLAQQIRGVAERLRGCGLREGERIVLLLKNSSSYIAAYFGALNAGGVVVAVHPDTLTADLLRIIQHVGAAGVVTTEVLWQKHKRSLEESGLRFALTPEKERRLGHAESSVPGPIELAQILYTSGTTGHPKGVMLSHGNLLANARAVLERLRLTPNDGIVAVLPFVFSYGNSVMLTHLLAGAKLVIEDNLFFPHCVVETMKREEVTGLSGVASNFAFLLRESGFSGANLPALRYGTSAGGPMPIPILEKVRERFPKIEFHVMYGQTEATARLTMLPAAEIDRKSGSAGSAIPGVELTILDESGNALQRGETGEIHVRGGNVMLGYWQDEEATRGKLRAGWLATGDLGYLDEEGFLFISGRQSELIKTGGFRVSPEEVEEALLKHPDVLEVGVCGVVDEMLGEIVVAGVVQQAGVEFAPKKLLAHCAAHLTPFKRPKTIHRMDRIPRSANGKILRRILGEKLTELQKATKE